MDKRLIIGMSGASGAPITVALLRQLKKHPEIETHLVVTKGAELTLASETNVSLEELKALACVFHPLDELGAAISSGTFSTMGMVIVPCSMKTAAGIVSGYSDNLLLRAADVCLKERRKLVLVARESPLSTIHLRNLYELSQLGAVIIPPMLNYYQHPKSIEDSTDIVVGRIIDQFEPENERYEWRGMNNERKQNIISSFTKTETVLNKQITAEGLVLPRGCQVLISGGDFPHIGAVGVVDENGSIMIHEFLSHREGLICRIWSEAFARAGIKPAVISAGVHYDQISPEGIENVISASGKLCDEVLSYINHAAPAHKISEEKK